MTNSQLHVVTGAFGYSGKYITARLLAAGQRVRTLTQSPNRPNPFQNQVEAFPFNFDDPFQLTESLRGATVLYNTYWVRFNYGKDASPTELSFKHADAVANTLVLFDAAKRAGVERIVHTSITNPSQDSPLEYFSGKARLERALIESGMSYAILRPTVIFGKEDVLINNIAWTLRRLPIFGVFGDGKYRLQPIYVEDFAKLAVEQGAARENKIIDAIGPETFSYRDLVRTIGTTIGASRPIVSVPPSIGYLAGWLIGKIVGDVTITRDEIEGLMQDLLYTNSPPAGETRLTDWTRQHKDELGKRYASELARRVNRKSAYEKL